MEQDEMSNEEFVAYINNPTNLSINTANNGNWECSISNFGEYNMDIRVHNAYVKGFTTPEITSEYDLSRMGATSRPHPKIKKNGEGIPLSLDMVCDENFLNYAMARRMSKEINYGKIDGDKLHKVMIGQIIFKLLDNQKRKKFELIYKKIVLENVSGLTCEGGEDTEFRYSLQMKSFISEEILYGSKGEVLYKI